MLDVKYKRLTAAGNIKASQGRLAWLIITNWDAAVKYVILNDAITGTGGEVAKFYLATKETKVFNFDPPLCCNTGIRIGTFEATNMEVTGGYD